MSGALIVFPSSGCVRPNLVRVTLGSTPSRSDAGGSALGAQEEKAGDKERVDKMIPRINFLHIVGS